MNSKKEQYWTIRSLYLYAILSIVTFSNVDCNNLDNVRYEIIQSLLDRYERRFTMLEIGVDQGYYSLKTAHNYDSVCVMAEVDNSPFYVHAGNQLLDICKRNSSLHNIILLNRLFTLDQLEHLSTCEDFDIVLALNFMDKFGNQWQKAIDVISHIGNNFILEIPSDDTKAKQYILAKGGSLLGSVVQACSDVYIISSDRKFLLRKTWLRSPIKSSCYCIESSFTDKCFFKPNAWPKQTLQVSSWLAGINLITFKMCDGIYPTSEKLQASLLSIKDTSHTDWLINNMIIQGNNLMAIDGTDNSCRSFYSEKSLTAHQELLNLNNFAQVEHYFWNKLVHVSMSRRQIVKFFSQLFGPSSLLFSIGFSDENLIDNYLGYGAKVIYINQDKKTNDLYEKFKYDDCICVNNDMLFQGLCDSQGIDSMIAQYGTPQFCIINQPYGSTYTVIKTLSQQIPCIAYNFDIRYQDDLKACLQHLTLLGYAQFNFSIRNIPHLVLASNKYIGTHKDWAHSPIELLHEIDTFSCLDYDNKNLFGYIYAKK